MEVKIDDEGNLFFPDFDKHVVSTKTFVIMLNVKLDILKMFETLPITDFIVIPKKRGRRKKIEVDDPNVDIPEGSIVTIKCENKVRGVIIKMKKSDDKNGNCFRNSITIVMVLRDKKINFKVTNNGVFQMTGCKRDEHPEECIKFIWDYIKTSKDIWSFKNETDTCLSAIIVPSMRNINFSLGFKVNRESLNAYINLQSQNNSMLDSNFGYTGVNIKMPVSTDLPYTTLKMITNTKDAQWNEKMIPWEMYLDTLSKKERIKKEKKSRMNTFLVFHSGKLIMSGMTADLMRDTYYEFAKMIQDCHDEIEEKLE